MSTCQMYKTEFGRGGMYTLRSKAGGSPPASWYRGSQLGLAKAQVMWQRQPASHPVVVAEK